MILFQFVYSIASNYLLVTVKQIAFGYEGIGGDMFSLKQIYKAGI